MSLKAVKDFIGRIFKKNSTPITYDSSSEGLIYNHNNAEMKTHIQGEDRVFATLNQTQTLTNKTIDASTNTLSNINTTHLAVGVLDTDLNAVSASDDTIPSAKATKDYIDQQILTEDEANEIAYNNATSGLTATDVQAAIDEVDSNVDDLVTLSGVALDSTDLGTFTGTTITDNVTVKTALQELETSLDSANTAMSDHLADTVDAHDASAISNVPLGNLAATDVQTALNELQSDIDTRATSTDLTNHESDTSTHGVGEIVGTTEAQTLTNKTVSGGSIETPTRLDVKQDAKASLETYATTASNGQLVFATDDKKMFQVIDGNLKAVGGAGLVEVTSGEILALNELVYISTGTGNDSGRNAGQAYKVDASNDDRIEVLGFVVKTTGVAGQLVEVQTSGILEGQTGLTAGKVYFASTTPGTISTTPPNQNGEWAVTVGLATSSTLLAINPVASASATFISSSESTFAIANNQTVTNVTGLQIDKALYRGFKIDYSIYRQTDTASSGVAQMGQLRGVYNTQSDTWTMSDDYSGQNAGVEFSITVSGQIQYTSTDITGTGYTGTLKHNIAKVFGV